MQNNLFEKKWRVMMDSYKKLSEELLKTDGIDPAKISDTERAMFKAILDKHLISGKSKQVLWRIIMKNPVTKIATAAIIAFACVVGVSLWKGTGSGVTLADVLEELEQVKTYSYQTYSTETGSQGSQERHAHVLISKDYGIRETLNKIDPDTGEIMPHETDYTSYNLGYVLIMEHETKKYLRMKYDDPAMFEAIRRENRDPRIIVNDILMCEHIRLRRSVIEGIDVEGFQTQDPNYDGTLMSISDDIMGGTRREVDVKLWVDAKTRLPVRLVEDIIKESGKKFHDVTDDFQWNVPVNKEDFEPVIPDDYTSQIGDFAYPAINEETAIKGLKAFVDVVGSYPVNPANPTKDEAFLQATKLDESEWDALSAKDMKKIVNESISPIFGFRTYYTKLAKENEYLAYYGETVGPDNADKVLLRWKLDNGPYRVIFGDLSVKTVTAEELAELEK
jgi:hypothetical protein